MSKNYQKIIDNPGEWIITRYGDFIRIKDSEKLIDKNLELIRKKLKLSGRFNEKNSEQKCKKSRQNWDSQVRRNKLLRSIMKLQI